MCFCKIAWWVCGGQLTASPKNGKSAVSSFVKRPVECVSMETLELGAHFDPDYYCASLSVDSLI